MKILSLLVLLAACGGGGDNTDDSSTPPDAPERDCRLSATVPELIAADSVMDCGDVDLTPSSGSADPAAWGDAQSCVRAALQSQTPFQVVAHHNGIDSGDITTFVGLMRNGTFETYRFYLYYGKGGAEYSTRFHCSSLTVSDCSDLSDELCVVCADETAEDVCHFPPNE